MKYTTLSFYFLFSFLFFVACTDKQTKSDKDKSAPTVPLEDEMKMLEIDIIQVPKTVDPEAISIKVKKNITRNYLNFQINWPFEEEKPDYTYEVQLLHPTKENVLYSNKDLSNKIRYKKDKIRINPTSIFFSSQDVLEKLKLYKAGTEGIRIKLSFTKHGDSRSDKSKDIVFVVKDIVPEIYFSKLCVESFKVSKVISERGKDNASAPDMMLFFQIPNDKTFGGVYENSVIYSELKSPVCKSCNHYKKEFCIDILTINDYSKRMYVKVMDKDVLKNDKLATFPLDFTIYDKCEKYHSYSSPSVKKGGGEDVLDIFKAKLVEKGLVNEN